MKLATQRLLSGPHDPHPVRTLLRYHPTSVRNAIDSAMRTHGYGFISRPRHVSLQRLLGTLPSPVLQTAANSVHWKDLGVRYRMGILK